MRSTVRDKGTGPESNREMNAQTEGTEGTWPVISRRSECKDQKQWKHYSRLDEADSGGCPYKVY